MTDPIPEPEEHDDIDTLHAALAALDLERERLIARLDQLQRAAVPVVAAAPPAPAKPDISNSSTAAEKVALFRRLFAGRTDVVPVRWENQKTGKAGYSPACMNAWFGQSPHLICGLPQTPRTHSFIHAGE